jgi:hypothetical protein
MPNWKHFLLLQINLGCLQISDQDSKDINIASETLLGLRKSIKS